MFFTRIWPNRPALDRPINSLLNRKSTRFAPQCTVCSQTLLISNFRTGEIVKNVLPFRLEPTSQLLTINITNMFVTNQAKFSQESTE